METKPNIEKQIDSVLESAKNIQPVDVPVGFTDRTMQRLTEEKKKNSSLYPALLRIAAIFILALVNIYTIDRIVNSPPQQQVSAPAGVNDLVSDYQVNDGTEITFEKTTSNEQPQAH